MELKKKIGTVIFRMKDNPLSRMLILMNLVFFHWDAKERLVHPGLDDPDITYYVIRPRGITEGLLSSWFGVLEEVAYAERNGFIPFVDFSEENSKYCQYYVEREVVGTTNAWEYYFDQPAKLLKEEICKKKNVILSGWNFRPKVKKSNDVKTYVKYISAKKYIQEIVDCKENELLSGKRVLGVFIRGTDYVALKPKGHPVQPTINQMLSKTEEVLNQFEIDNIYLVTEDEGYYKCFVREYGKKVISLYNNAFVEYREGEFLQRLYSDDPYERGLRYLVKILLLARCDYLVCSNASGSLFAKLMRNRSSIFEYWFDLGNY